MCDQEKLICCASYAVKTYSIGCTKHYSVGCAGRSRIIYKLMNYFISPNVRQLQIKATTLFLLWYLEKETWKI
jgi:hypothetical protein